MRGVALIEFCQLGFFVCVVDRWCMHTILGVITIFPMRIKLNSMYSIGYPDTIRIN
jgi:hypothetical protein